MTHQEIQKAAKQKVDAKKAFYVLSFIFGLLSIIILGIMIFIHLNYDPPIGEYFWMFIPLVGFAIVLGILYFSIFGIPGFQFATDEWEEQQMKQEMQRLYRKSGLSLPDDPEMSEEDRLELKELERLKQKWEGSDDFV